MSTPEEQIAELRERVEALETAIQTEEFTAIPERVEALEQNVPLRVPKVISLAEVYTKSSGGARVVLLYIVIAAVGLPVAGLFWLMGFLGDNPANARSMITVVFCMGTMAIAGILAVVAIRKDQLDKAKEVLIILIGIFGTIVGYYFGSSELPAKPAPNPPAEAPPVTTVPTEPNTTLPPSPTPAGAEEPTPTEKKQTPTEAPKPVGNETPQ
ncbi:hypothetical protein Pan241w_28610 [Gimesia alba]|uniref:Preprotein translocase subunit SecG n=1 Tax=Gimesia alba TaxID=2527973 RepID=A0A517RFW3_9PLAN|nr:hypothetical protein [Gimesia alba]QDT42772.1 hypothetical protein Pan241w_28610 [Gimesia alba]